MKYELYYRTGGHVGPFHSLEDARKNAKRRANDTERYIRIVDRSTNKTVEIVRHDARKEK